MLTYVFIKKDQVENLKVLMNVLIFDRKGQ